MHGGLWGFVVGVSLGAEKPLLREITRQLIPGSQVVAVFQTDTQAAQQLNQFMVLSVELVSHIKVAEGAREKWALTAFDATMPAHKHGMVVKPTFQSIGEGKWKIFPVKLHMPGHWRLSFTYTKDSQVQIISQDVQVL